jgi:hypothetical protein
VFHQTATFNLGQLRKSLSRQEGVAAILGNRRPEFAVPEPKGTLRGLRTGRRVSLSARKE